MKPGRFECQALDARKYGLLSGPCRKVAVARDCSDVGLAHEWPLVVKAGACRLGLLLGLPRYLLVPRR